jgi:hypothetical protein
MIAMMPLQARASKQPFSTKETLRKKKSLDAPGVLQRTDTGEKLQSCLRMAQQLRKVDNQAIDLFPAWLPDAFESA